MAYVPTAQPRDDALIAEADARYVLQWLRQTHAPENIIGLQARATASLSAAVLAALQHDPQHGIRSCLPPPGMLDEEGRVG